MAKICHKMTNILLSWPKISISSLLWGPTHLKRQFAVMSRDGNFYGEKIAYVKPMYQKWQKTDMPIFYPAMATVLANTCITTAASVAANALNVFNHAKIAVQGWRIHISLHTVVVTILEKQITVCTCLLSSEGCDKFYQRRDLVLAPNKTIKGVKKQWDTQ